MSATRESLYLVDAHSLIFQVFHAIPEMTSPAGLPTNAVFGFTKDLLYLRNDRKPKYLVVCFDVGARTFRDDIYKEYKAHRAPMPDDLQLQIPLIRDVIAAMRLPVLGMEGYEADDLIATLARQGEERGLDVVICSSDKDCRQLLSEHVRIFNLRKQEFFDRDALLKDWGVAPEQVIDFQTLVGDSVDNVPGVPGIGPKTASKLLQEYHTLDNLVAHVDEIPGKKQEAIKGAIPTLETSRQLVRLRTDVPLQPDWEHWSVQEWDGPRLLDLFRGFGFQRFAEVARQSMRGAPKEADVREPATVPAGPRTSSRSQRPVQGSLFDAMDSIPGDVDTPVTQPSRWQAAYRLIDTPERFDALLGDLRQQCRFVIDVQATGSGPRGARLVGLTFCWKEAEAHYVPVRGPHPLEQARVLEALKPLLESSSSSKLNENIKFDVQVLREHGIDMKGITDDPMIADYLLNAGARTHGLRDMAEIHLEHQITPLSDLTGTGKNQREKEDVPCTRMAEYAGEQADVAWRLMSALCSKLEEKGLRRPHEAQPSRNGEMATSEVAFLYEDLEIPLIEVLADMEYHGIRLDVPLLKEMSVKMAGELTAYEQEIYQLAGREFNIGSPKQLREILYQEQGFKAGRKTAIMKEASTDQETLEMLAAEGHKLPKKLIEHRKIAKLKSTYVDALPALVNKVTERVHASFNQTVAATGRLSSSDPNLQNIPIRTEQGREIRQAFLPQEGWRLLTADYSQIELRLLAHFCGDAPLREAFAQNRDIHAQVAAQVFGVAEEDVTGEMRRTAKMINFGVIYGISAFGLAARLEISKDDAAKFIEAYFARYPAVLAYQDRLLADCRDRGYVGTILGRRRAIKGIRPRSSYRARNQPEREAINMQIQGSAADLIKVAMVNIHRRLKRERREARMLLQIHDELVFEMPPAEVTEVSALVREEMAGALRTKLEVPLGVDMGVGDNWLNVEDV